SRYSIIGTRARAVLTERDGQAHWRGDVPAGVPTSGSPVEALRAVTSAFRAARQPHLPPFSGGMVGFVAYDAVRHWEKLPDAPPDEIGVPDLSLLLAQDVVIHDAHDSTVVLVANALNLNATDDGVDAAYDDALARLERMRERLRTPIAGGAVVYDPAGRLEPKARTSRLEYEQAVHEA